MMTIPAAARRDDEDEIIITIISLGMRGLHRANVLLDAE